MEEEVNGALRFLDATVKRDDVSLESRQCIASLLTESISKFQFCTTLSHKKVVVHSLAHRAKTLCSTDDHISLEMNEIKEKLKQTQYSD